MTITRRTALALPLAASAGFGTARAQSNIKPLRLGVLNDPSGVFADNGGLGVLIASKLAAEDFGGSILGRPIEFLYANDQNKPDVAIGIAREWMDRQDVQVIIDGASSNVGLALQQLAREKRRIYVICGPATSDLTGTACSPFGFHFCYDTYALANGTARALARQGQKSWFFIMADYAFGHALERDATRFVQAAGGTVIGSARAPLGTTDYSSYLVQAQASGAQVIALANAAADTQNTIKQAAEFGIGRDGKQHLAALIMFITDVLALGLETAQGLNLTTSFYWDLNDATRAWTKRFRMHKDAPPSMIQAGAFCGVNHYLKAVTALGTADATTVAAKMQSTPVTDMYNDGIAIRVDGRVLHRMYLAQVKAPEQSTYRDDVYKILASTPGADAFRPLGEGGCPLVKS